jgi:hypothetical protein
MMRRVVIGSALVAGWFALVGGGVAQQADFVPLFNGKDLTGFYTFLVGKGTNNDPDKVFTVADGMIRVSGQRYGGFITEKEYENYHLVVEWKWGEKMWPPDDVQYLSHILTRQPLGWPTVE